MADYQVRGWRGWHHHMAMVCLAMLFITKERVAQAEDVPLLSVRDVVELLEVYLPRRARTEEEVFAAMTRRHGARQKAIDSALKNQPSPPPA